VKVDVDADVCAGHGVCVGLAPDVFELTDAGYTVAKTGAVPAEHEAAVRAAVNQCPTGAITIS
jgi:ferredoxin